MRCIANFLRNSNGFLKDERNQKNLIFSSFIFLSLCLLIVLASSAVNRGEDPISVDHPRTPSMPITPTITPTKWWIRTTVTLSPNLSDLATTTSPLDSVASNCPAQFSSPVKVAIYAYISLSPPLPNRLRSSAGLSKSYLGQIEPGGGLRIIDGPICADGYLWWLVESLHGGLQGWTVEGKSSEQWLVPCPNERVACSQTADSVSLGVVSKNENNKDKKEDVCKSNKLAVGMLAQVGQDSLLVVRLEPVIGKVQGRAGPTSIVQVIDGPTCVGNSVWWKVNVFALNLIGWATENDLYACPKDSACSLGSPN